eukprot:4039071-Heterocapsa_arctica.AAC.1
MSPCPSSQYAGTIRSWPILLLQKLAGSSLDHLHDVRKVNRPKVRKRVLPFIKIRIMWWISGLPLHQLDDALPMAGLLSHTHPPFSENS